MKPPKRRKKPQSLLERFQTTCGWCGTHIPADQEVFGGGIKVRSGIDLSPHYGQVIPVALLSEEKSVLIAVSTPESDAHADGYDMMYMVCSEACGRRLKRAFEQDMELGNKLGL